jgi:TPR repeat protein
LEYGIGIAKNVSEAVKYYKFSADQGNEFGQNNYDNCLEYGTGISRDAWEAVQYYKLSADQGNADGQTKYACCSPGGCRDPRSERKQSYALSILLNIGTFRLISETRLAGGTSPVSRKH